MTQTFLCDFKSFFWHSFPQYEADKHFAHLDNFVIGTFRQKAHLLPSSHLTLLVVSVPPTFSAKESDCGEFTLSAIGAKILQDCLIAALTANMLNMERKTRRLSVISHPSSGTFMPTKPRASSVMSFVPRLVFTTTQTSVSCAFPFPTLRTHNLCHPRSDWISTAGDRSLVTSAQKRLPSTPFLHWTIH